MSEAASATSAPNVPFFKKRAQSKNVRKRNLSDDESDPLSATSASSEPSGLGHTSLSSVSKKRSAKRAPQTSNADMLQSSSNSSANRLASKDGSEEDKTVGVSYKATLEGNIRIDDATRTQEIDTAHDRDAQAIIDRHMRAVEHGIDEPTNGGDDGLYKGLAGYKSHIQKGEVTNSKIRVGPMRASSNIRVTNRFDYQPDICKDYKETGFCGYGDSCIYMHDRGDYKAGWQLDQEWEAEQRAKKLALIEGLDDEAESSSDDDEVPFACLICREEFKHPVVTRCNHYFCEKCALKRYAKTPKCAACQTPTGGLFNSVSKDFLKKVAERKAKIEESNRRRDEDDAANAAALAAQAASDAPAADEDTGMVEDLSVVGMGGVPNLPRRSGDDDDDSDDDDSD
ncbi:RING finger protein 113A [Entomortierella parvispora]|uniref:Pre-mRNA-splicing factor CWC24 n=1 Tax=Entomortierella parvispora TaxID=205924 RepID=A0A9P3HG39_9FUNG|nr:RING finger protein 113A [Entomortierella parvispora]